MGWFEYEGLTPGQMPMTGRIEAPDRETAQRSLAEMRLDVRDLHDSEPPPQAAGALNADDLIFFNEQLASLAHAGIALDEGLAQLARDVESPQLRQWIEGLVADLRQGQPLEAALAARGSGLPTLYSDVVRAGIESGHLSAALLNLNQHLRLMGDTRRILWETASYPIVVALLALGVVAFFFAFLLPRFEEMYADFNAPMPALTTMVLAFGRNFVSVLLAIAVLAIVFIVIWRSLRRTQGGRITRETITLKIPMLGPVYRASMIAGFLRSVSTAIGTGISLPRAVRLSCEATGSPLLLEDARRLASELERGESAFKAARSAVLIPPLFGYCVQAAASHNDLPSALAKLAQAYEARAVHTQSHLRAFLLPFFIILLGGFLGLAIIAVFLPLVSLLDSVSGGS